MPILTCSESVAVLSASHLSFQSPYKIIVYYCGQQCNVEQYGAPPINKTTFLVAARVLHHIADAHVCNADLLTIKMLLIS